MLDRLLIPAAERLDRRVRWDRLWWPLGILVLIGLRDRLRQHNLRYPYSSGPPVDDDPDGEPPPPLGRPIDGRFTHPLHPSLGATGTPFGRNTAIEPEQPLATSTPDAAAVSSALLRRRDAKLIPAETLNLLAAAWLQFEVHDWFAHRVQAVGELPLGLRPFTPDPGGPEGLPVFLSDQTHWWDASQLYGANETFASEVRCDDSWRTGKVKVDDELLDVMSGFLRRTAAGAANDDMAGPGQANPVPNLWTGLALFHVAFAHEHNAICDRLRRAYPAWTGEQLYAKARLINVAVMAKIHTVEWTPALLAHPTTARAIRATWWGLLGERVRRRFWRFGDGELLSGIPGSRLDDEVPYAITEDFVAVYRMHQLIPDEVAFCDAGDGAPLAGIAGGPTLSFEELTATAGEPDRAKSRLNEIGYANAWYSLGIAHPGALTLHNNPDFKPLLRPDKRLDLGAADIMRTRECGVPRYNAFRRQLGMRPAESFLQLADGDEQQASDIAAVYGDVDRVDLAVGLLADYKPRGFAISDTAFRVFLLMAARRLRSDPFFTSDYTAAVYTQIGLAWIDAATMNGILARHYPELRPALRAGRNPFKPWPKAIARRPPPAAPGA